MLKELLDCILDRMRAFKNRNSECDTISANFIIFKEVIKVA